MKEVILFFFVALSILSCIPASDEVPTEVRYELSDTTLQKVYEYQDRQMIDSLLSFTSHRDPTLRFQTARALASHDGYYAVDSLAKLLGDPIPEIQQAAAYALGQQRDVRAENILLGSLKLYDSIPYNNPVNSTIMEAIGKAGSEKYLDALATAANIKPGDNQILLGQARGIYRYMLEGKTSDKASARMLELVVDRTYPADVRLIAAHYLSRASDLDLEASKFQLARAFEEETNSDIKMALAYALRNVADPEILKSIFDALQGDEDYRVKVNLLKSVGSYQYIKVIEKVLNILSDKNLHVANAAAGYLISHGQPADASLYAKFIKDEMHWSTKAKIYEGVLKHLPRNYANTRIRTINKISKAITDSDNPYEKAAYISALSADVVNFKIIHDLAAEEDSPIINSAVASGYGKILSNPKFNRAYKSQTSRNRTKTNILEYLKESIATGQVGAISEAAGIIANKDFGFQELDVDSQFLQEAIARLELPKQVEALYAIQNAIANLKGTTIENKPPAHNHDINWDLVSNINDTTRVNIVTDKGTVKLKLFPTEAPGTVANFVNLANSNFYDGKVFHRVVPGFVIQGGCPIGDGYGGLDYSIRSELSQLYYDAPGKIGMASAGKHTEGVQFFITQAPTPHLDGKYTIFGEVVSGMDIVHDIQVGDKITDVQIIN